MSTFLWVVFPYLAIGVFIAGMIWRYRYDKFGWTTRSSQIYESRLLRLGSPLFHFGILAVVGGSGSGKSGGHRSVIVYVEGDRALFLFVFSKNERSNIDAHELETLRESAKILADLPIATLLETNWIEIPYD